MEFFLTWNFTHGQKWIHFCCPFSALYSHFYVLESVKEKGKLFADSILIKTVSWHHYKILTEVIIYIAKCSNEILLSLQNYFSLAGRNTGYADILRKKKNRSFLWPLQFFDWGSLLCIKKIVYLSQNTFRVNCSHANTFECSGQPLAKPSKKSYCQNTECAISTNLTYLGKLCSL